MVVLHPGQVPIVNEIFSPSNEEIERAVEILNAMEQAISERAAATIVRGRMVDLAHAHTSFDLLSEAQSFGFDVTIPAFWASREGFGVNGTSR